MKKLYHSVSGPLLAALCTLFCLSIAAQNVGVGTSSPKEKLHVAGNMLLDSILKGNSIVLNNPSLSQSIRMSADSGTLEFWSNDTMWYQLKVTSPPQEVLNAGEYTIVEGTTDEGAEFKEYRNTAGQLIARTLRQILPNVLLKTEIYDGPCIKEERIEALGLFGLFNSQVIVYSCPSGDTCYIDDVKRYFDYVFGLGNPIVVEEKTRRNVKVLLDFYRGDLLGPTAEGTGVVVPEAKTTEELRVNGDTKSSVTRSIKENIIEFNLDLDTGTKGGLTFDPSKFRIQITNGIDSFQMDLDEKGPEFHLAPDLDVGWLESQFGQVSQRTTNGVDTVFVDTRPAERTIEYHGGMSQCTVNVDGFLSKAAGTFRIDHPLDPFNKLLYHSFVESPDMMNVYNGNIITDKDGIGIVSLPDYFEALNKDFRYQLTCIGEFAMAIVKEKIQNNQFVIQTDKPNVEVSWQVTGIRHDTYAENNRVRIEVEKTGAMKGKLLYKPNETL